MACNILTFNNGDFNGHKVRITSDRTYVSVYDVLGVIGFKNHYQTWSNVNKKNLNYNETNESSWKMTKFTGQGKIEVTWAVELSSCKLKVFNQVNDLHRSSMHGDSFNCYGYYLANELLDFWNKVRIFLCATLVEVIIRMMKSFFFVVDTEVLIFLDESLVEEVQRNKQVAEDDITSTQAFMQSSFTSSNRTLVNDMNIESEQLSQVQNEPKEGTLAYQRMQAEIDQMVIANITARSLAKLQHVQHSTEAYNDFKNFIDDNDFQDPRIKQDLYDTNINMLNEAMGVKPHTLSNLTSSSETRDVVESNLPRYYTIDQVAVQHLGLKSLSTQQKSIMGRKAKKLWKESYPTEASKQVYKYVDGEQRAVNCYPQKHVEKMKQIILEHCEN